METIFEHHITKLEMDKLSACTAFAKNKDAYLKYRDVDAINEDLYKLYMLRNQVEKAENYIKKITNPQNEGSVSYF